MCRAWRDAALRRYRSVDSFLWGGRAREGPDQGYFDGVHGRDFFSDKIQSGRVLSSQIKHFVLRLPSSGGVGIDQQNRPTLILAAAKPWNTFSSIMSFRMVFDRRFYEPNQLLLVQEVVQQLETLRILRLEGPDVGIIHPLPLELTSVMQHRYLQKLWLSNFTLRLTKAAAFSLQALAVIYCAIDDPDEFAFLLHNSRDR